jgi:polysaccharide biosynthesis/export protein
MKAFMWLGPASGAWRSCQHVLVLTVLIGLVTGCRSPVSSSEPAPLNPGMANYATNLLQEGDTVAITFQYSTNFNAIQKITLDGVLNLEAVGAVKAAGKTPIELQAELARLYKPQVKDDIITVKLLAAAASVYVGGAVNRPGKIPMERPLTAMEAIMEAGGYDLSRAKLSAVTVLRIESGHQRTYHLNLKKALRGDTDEPFYLKPFDIVHVPGKTINF